MTKPGHSMGVFLATCGAVASATLLTIVACLRFGPGHADAEPASNPAGSHAADPASAGAGTKPRAASTVDAILSAADKLVQQGEADRAEAVLRAAVAEQPEDQELRLALAGACVMQKKLAPAYEQYEAALAIGPRTAEVEFNAGIVASQLGRIDRAEEHFSAAQASDLSDPRYPLYLAQVQIRAEEFDAARKNLMLATRLDENSAVAWGTLADLSLRQSEPNVALQLVKRARTLEPDSTAWRVIEARARNRLGQAAEALAVLQGIAVADRRQLPILRLVGETYGLLGKPAQAAKEFEEAAQATPANPDLLFETAVWCERAGRQADALRYAQQATRAGSESASKMAQRLSHELSGG
ncbi:MAG: tetratricopeptide repeat protein [Phycisphaerales bacterium]|nr:tetratricopeptide repeat protein [Phycisphaerales bacterium]